MGFSGIIMRASWDFNGNTIIRYLHPLLDYHFPYQKVPRRGFTPCEDWDLYNGIIIIMGLKGVIVRLSWDGRVHVGRASQEQQSCTVLVSMLCLELWRVSSVSCCGFWVLRLSDFDGKTHHETRRMVTQTCPTSNVPSCRLSRNRPFARPSDGDYLVHMGELDNYIVHIPKMISAAHMSP